MLQVQTTIEVEDSIVDYLDAKGFKIIAFRKTNIGELYYCEENNNIQVCSEDSSVNRLVLEKFLKWPEYFTNSFPGIHSFMIVDGIIKFNYWDSKVDDCGFEGTLDILNFYRFKDTFSGFKHNFLYKKSNM